MGRILITGGSGYVGSRVAKVLAHKGHKVIVVDIVTPKERGIVFPKNVEFRRSDLRRPLEAQKALKGSSVVLHLAADIGSMSYMRRHKADIITNNAAIDAAVYPALIHNKAKWIVYSSSSMVFQHPPRFPYKESDLAFINPPSNTYGFSKLAGEYFCRAYEEEYKLPYTIIRYHNIFGPGEDSKGATPGDIHVIPALLEKVLKGQYPLQFHGDQPHKATRPFVFVDDAVAATVTLVERAVKGDARIRNEDFNIGNDEHLTILDLGKLIWKHYGDGRPFKHVVIPLKSDTALRREVSIDKIKKILGWTPTTPLIEGLAQTAQWLKERTLKTR